MAHDVFISHSAKDKVTAEAVCAMLESNGIRCWIAPRDVLPSLEWGRAIVEAIEESRIMVLVFTANANSSPQIRREVERAVNCGVAILPLRIEDVLPDKGLDYFIGNVHWLDALTPPLEAHLKNLAGTIKIVLARMELRGAPMPPVIAKEVLEAAKPPEPTNAPTAEPAVPHPPEDGDDDSGFRSNGADEGQFGIGKAASLHSRGGSGTRGQGEWRTKGGTVAASPARSRTGIPAWIWAAGTVAALLLVGVFIGVHFTSHSAPVVTPEPVTQPTVAPNPASAPPTANDHKAEKPTGAARTVPQAERSSSLSPAPPPTPAPEVPLDGTTLSPEWVGRWKADAGAYTQSFLDLVSIQHGFSPLEGGQVEHNCYLEVWKNENEVGVYLAFFESMQMRSNLKREGQYSVVPLNCKDTFRGRLFKGADSEQLRFTIGWTDWQNCMNMDHAAGTEPDNIAGTITMTGGAIKLDAPLPNEFGRCQVYSSEKPD
jgi:hypothetical protein